MALEGALTYTHISYSETETEDILVTYSDGSEETIQQPKQTLTTESYDNVYVYVKSIQMHTLTVNGEKKEQVHYHIAGYESREARDADNENFLFFEGHQLVNYDNNLNICSQCYNAIKEREGFNQLTKV